MFEVTYVEHKDNSITGSKRNTRYALIAGVIYVQYWDSWDGYYKRWEKFLSEAQQSETATFWTMIKEHEDAVKEDGHLI